MQPFIRTFKLLSPAERRQVYWLLPGIVIMAILEITAIAFISPFLSLILNPESLAGNTLLQTIYQMLGFQDTRSFLVFVGLLALALLVISNGFSMMMEWLLTRFAWLRDYSLSYRLLTTYLHQPYSFFVGRNSADLQKNMLSEVQQAIRGMLIPSMELLANAVKALFIIALMLVVNPLLAIGLAGVLGLAYLLIFAGVQRRLKRLGEERVIANQQRFQNSSEALGGVKEIKLLGREAQFLTDYGKAARHYSLNMAQSDIISEVPRFVLDTVAIGSMIGMILVLLVSSQDASQVIPVVGLYAFAGYRLLPALQKTYRTFAKARFNIAAVDTIAQDLRDEYRSELSAQHVAPLPFRQALELQTVNFRYPDASDAALHDISLNIKRNTSVAFVGTTGSGKTTLIDVILGLLSPTSGQLLVDAVALNPDNLRSWQRNLGYVPQQIYLSDSSLAQNIAFGIPAKDIDMQAVIKAATIANLHDFVERDLPQGYDTIVGERGVRLSGGQRQRIGIARALYHDPAILILDEATSALDSVTEEAVFEAIGNVTRSKTVIMIAHRISTVENCDEIFVMERGRIMGSGSYQELIGSSAQFRALAHSTAST